MKIYTRTGDDGTTSLAGGRRVPKSHIRIEAYGSVDELIPWIGLLRVFRENATRRDILLYIQDQLMRSAAILADEKNNVKAEVHFPDPECISVIENEIDKMDAILVPLKKFILPGGHILVSYCQIARCVCRRAEREVLKLNNEEKVPDIICKFLNRLSDYLFVLSRLISLELDIKEISWPI